MSNPAPPNRFSFEENISTLLEELLLAAKWERPSILLAVHKSKFGQDKAAAALETRLAAVGQHVVRITVDQDRSDVPHIVVGTPAAGQSIFFVSNLDWGGGTDYKDAYRALNIYRELFVDHHIKIVLWLTTSEASGLARYAPDFWAFRHRVVEFTGQRIPRKISLPSGVLLWDIQTQVDPLDTLQARLALRQDLLDRLPHNPEARSARIDLLYNLGYLHWMMGSVDKSAEDLRSALDLAREAPGDRAAASPLNGLAILSYEAKDFEQTANLLRQAIEVSPDRPHLLMNQSVTASALGRNQEALRLAGKAVNVNSRDPRVWAARGYVYAALGKFDEAITCFSKATELAPRSAVHHAALAICYNFVEHSDESVRQLEIARTLAHEEMPALLDIYKAALLENPSISVQRAQSAVRNGQLSVYELRRDPNLALLLDFSELEEIKA
jgi:tetratricopeptide (TPR) repeat protein